MNKINLVEHHVSLNNAKMAPRKARAFREILIKRNARLAMDQLNLEIGTDTATTIAKLLKSGIAGLKLKNKEADEKNIFVSRFLVNEGLKMKRQFIRSRGKATRYMKQNSQIHVYLAINKIEDVKTEDKKVKESNGTES